MAEEAIVDLASFGLAGGRRAALRSMVHKASRLGLTVRRYDRAGSVEPAVDEQLEEISEEWLAEKRLGEMGFSVGRFSLESLDRVWVFACLDGERVTAFTTWRPYRGGRAALLDLMRKRGQAPSGTMDLLVARSLEALGAAGLEEASLANAPLANMGEPRGGLERGVALLFENLNAFYGYKNLFQFKKKFDPRWEGRYLVYPRGADLPRVAYALSGVHGAGGWRRLLLHR
jgi:phosphatidylglycerol lysyltransferase